jgi:catechol 2,3-dioxygenase-like lactoylglutathione lyase family enzyme
MRQSIAQVAIVVRDYDEAIEFYVRRLGFVLVEERPIEAERKRWVVIAPPGASESRLLLARAVGAERAVLRGTPVPRLQLQRAPQKRALPPAP